MSAMARVAIRTPSLFKSFFLSAVVLFFFLLLRTGIGRLSICLLSLTLIPWPMRFFYSVCIFLFVFFAQCFWCVCVCVFPFSIHNHVGTIENDIFLIKEITANNWNMKAFMNCYVYGFLFVCSLLFCFVVHSVICFAIKYLKRFETLALCWIMVEGVSKKQRVNKMKQHRVNASLSAIIIKRTVIKECRYAWKSNGNSVKSQRNASGRAPNHNVIMLKSWKISGKLDSLALTCDCFRRSVSAVRMHSTFLISLCTYRQ